MKRRLTKQDRYQCIRLLTGAKESLEREEEIPICYALRATCVWLGGWVGGKHKSCCLRKYYEYIIAWEHQSLEEYYCYFFWITANHRDLWTSCADYDVVFEKQQAGRIAWLNWMINELEEGRGVHGVLD